MKNIQILILSVALVGFLSSCSSLNRTKERTEGYRVYDIQGGNLSSISNHIKGVIQKNSDTATFTNNIPPHPLPEKASRFSLVNPFGNSGIGALMARQGETVKIPKCEDSPFTSMSRGNFEGSEKTTFFVCLQPYAKGIHMDIYYAFTKTSGGFNPSALGKSLAQSIVGDSSQFIPRTIAALEQAVQRTGASIKIVQAYP
ncbi:hypothetical protein MNBD_GAMMA12-35 [hydrothermal vent metagenome]|uniref:Lipoprotein n=1 Tax=hydrothermal vent metagenome TaxID=652676 RepID=A0A3B0YLF4_9ZZZZ